MDLGLEGRTAVVSASTSGLGLAIARSLAAEKANVVIFGRRGHVAESEADQLGSAIGIQADLTDPETPERVIDEAVTAFGQVDILIWNSGGPAPGPAQGLKPEDLTASSRLLVDPFLRFVELTVPGMRNRGWGRVLAVGSSGTQQPIAYLAASNVLRAGVAAFCKTLANETATDGVTVNMVLPGRIDTPRVRDLDAARAARELVDVSEIVRRSQAAIPAGRYGTPSELADMAAFLCSDRASYVTGSQVRVDGGIITSTH